MIARGPIPSRECMAHPAAAAIICRGNRFCIAGKAWTQTWSPGYCGPAAAVDLSSSLEPPARRRG
ncbi:hypothetical protein BRAO375_2330005 [Bradyrhizobium sp. ORS 375]|nr:hypothetical protein BRAO375_2330005 [Bradyrhizobium sp. ORS 375]